MKNWIKVLLSIALIVIIIGAFSFAYINSLPKKTTSTIPTPTISVNYSNFADVVSKNNIVKAIPDKSTIILKFYNFNSGEREIEKSYIITTGKIIEGEAAADVTIFLSSKYLSGLTNKNFCDIIQKANNNGDLGIESELSDSALAWKLKSMFKYKSCLGM